MPVVPQNERISTIRQWGISAPVIRLSCGEHIHDLFSITCEGPPWYVYNDTEVPNGPPFAPLWEFADGVTGVWKRNGRLEFIEFDVEAPEEYWVLAQTEQGFLASLLLWQYENREDLDWAAFREPADAIGFRFLDELIAAYEQSVNRGLNDLEEFQRRFVAQIDKRCSLSSP